MKKLLRTALVVCSVICMTASASAQSIITDGGFEIRTNNQSIQISPPQYTYEKDGTEQELVSVVPGETVNVGIAVKNTSDTQINARAITCVYDNDGTMSSAFASALASIPRGGEEVLNYTFTFPAESEKCGSAKTMILDSISGLCLYSEPIKFPNTGLNRFAWKLSDGFSLTAAEKNSGRSSLKITGNGSEAEAYQFAGLGTEKTYKLNFYAKGSSEFSYAVKDTNGVDLSTVERFGANSDWTKKSVLFKTADDENAKICFINTGNSGISYVDDVIISNQFVENSGFENGTEGWILDGNCFEVSSEDVHSGSNSLKMISRSSGATASASAEVMPYSTYILMFNSKAAENFKFRVTDELANVLADSTIEKSSGWAGKYFIIKTGECGKINISVTLESTFGRTSYIDDIELSNLIYPEIVENGDIETGTKDGWKSSSGSVSLIPDDSEKLSGDWGLRVQGRAQVSDFIYQELASKVNEAGAGVYHFSAGIKGDNGIAILTYRYSADGLPVVEKTSYGVRSTEWQTAGVDIDVPQNYIDAGINTFQIRIWCGTPTGGFTGSDIWVDDVSLLKVK